ncbi:MAG: 3-dehydroquinate synthase [Candidatus Eremiobacteraeota bacterium]|nr:3-dehydroquinate synthase [Candidatus Eremiobacteraeota bacterium]
MAAQEEDSPLVVNDDLGYPVVVGEDLLETIAAFARARGTGVVVVHDANAHVARIAKRVAERIGDRCTAVLGFVLGERRKRLSTVERVLDAFASAGLERSGLVLGVGGGIASDLFAFAAATYMRGVAYAHVATSLVAMVDAAIGGKTGIDLKGGKNLAGAFAPPVAVFCEVRALFTLPLRALREGLAEVVKAAILEGGELFEALEALAAHRFVRWPWIEVVAAAARVKTRIVAQDPRETGVREALNLGHTFGHALERASNYRITHGAGVALGLRAAGLLALRTGRFSAGEHLRVLALLALLGMPLRTSARAGAVFAAMQSDKKRRGGRLRFVVPRAIGDVEWGVECDVDVVRGVLKRLERIPSSVRRSGEREVS